MELKVVKQDDDLTHIALAGRLDVAGEQEIREQLLGEIVTRKKPLLVDMTAVSFLGSMGLGLLFQCAKTLRVDGAKMVVLNPQPMIAQVLEGSGVSEIVQIAPDMKKALKVLGF
ncbi:MAG: STAS domain-containing protein [Thermodesulfobacteriota bacterium]